MSTVSLRWQETHTPGVWAGYCGGEGCDRLLLVSKPPHGWKGLLLEPGYRVHPDGTARYDGSARSRFFDRGRARKRHGRGHAERYGIPGSDEMRSPGFAAQRIVCRRKQCLATNEIEPQPEAPKKPGRRPPRIVHLQGEEPVPEGPEQPKRRVFIRWKGG